MKKSLLAVAAVVTLALTAGTPAHAQRGVAAGVAAGIIGGAIVGGALASPYYYGPGYAYGPGYGPGSGTTEGQPPRSYDFRYLGDETPKPTTEAEKAEFRTTLRVLAVRPAGGLR